MFTVVAARLLHPVRYGEFAAIVALINLVLIASTAVTRTVVAVATTLDDRGMTAWLARWGSTCLALVGAVGLMVVGLFAHAIAETLHLQMPLWVWLAGAAMIPGYVGAVWSGLLYTLQLFLQAGVINVVAALVKLAVLVLLLSMGMSVTGGTLASLTEVTMVALGSLAVLFRPLRGVRPKVVPWMKQYRELLGLPLAPTVARLLYFNVDILMARHYLGPVEAGLFAALATIGRIIAYGTGALPTVVYPYLIRFRRNWSLTARTLLLTLGATLVVGGGGTAFLYVFPELVVRVFGHSYQAIAPYMGIYGLAFLLYSLVYILLQYLLSAKSWWLWAYAIGGSMLEIVALVFFHRNIPQFTWVVTGFFGVMLVITGAHAAHDLLRLSQQSASEGAPEGA